MSYEIVKGIKIDEKNEKVMIKSDSNNVFPKHFHWWECVPLSRDLKEKGKIEVEKEILYAYWNGEFQKSNNLYDKVVLYESLTVNKYSWGDVNGRESKDAPYSDEVHTKQKEEVKAYLYNRYLEFKNRKKVKYIIHRKNSDSFAYKKTSRSLYSTPYKKQAKVFNSYEDARLFIGYMFNIEDYNIVEVSNNFYRLYVDLNVGKPEEEKSVWGIQTKHVLAKSEENAINKFLEDEEDIITREMVQKVEIMS